MSYSIWKYPVPLTAGNGGPLTLSMPDGAQILCLQMQDDVPTLWALVDLGAGKVQRVFQWFGTGWTIGEHVGRKMVYVGTIQTTPCVFHLFERVP